MTGRDFARISGADGPAGLIANVDVYTWRGAMVLGAPKPDATTRVNAAGQKVGPAEGDWMLVSTNLYRMTGGNWVQVATLDRGPQGTAGAAAGPHVHQALTPNGTYADVKARFATSTFTLTGSVLA